MENQLLLLFFILIEIVILGYCETDPYDSSAPRFNEKIDLGNIDLSKRKDFYLFENNEFAPEAKSIAKRPTILNERFSQSADAVNSLEIRQEVPRNNFSEKLNEMSSEFQQDGYNNWLQEKGRSFYPNKQESRQETIVEETFNRRINPQANNEWDKNGKFFQNSQARWNEEKNFGQYQTVLGMRNGENYGGRLGAGVQNFMKPNIYSDMRNANGGQAFVGNTEMNGYFQPKSEAAEKKVSLTLLNEKEEVKNLNNYGHEVMKSPFPSQLNSKFNYYNRNVDGFRNPNFHSPEKGVIINVNTECSTTKPFSTPIFHKLIFAPKPQISQSQIPTFRIPATTLITRQVSTPIYYL